MDPKCWHLKYLNLKNTLLSYCLDTNRKKSIYSCEFNCILDIYLALWAFAISTLNAAYTKKLKIKILLEGEKDVIII